jgi:hypothetical protein
MVVFAKRLLTRRILSSVFIVLCLVLYSLSLGTSSLLRSISASRYRQFLSRAYPEAHYLLTVPMTFWHWRGIAEDGDRYLILNSDTGHVESRLRFMKDKAGDAIIDNGYVKVFLQYARYPTIAYNGDTVSFSNAIYSQGSFRLQLVREPEGRLKLVGLSGFDLQEEL